MSERDDELHRIAADAAQTAVEAVARSSEAAAVTVATAAAHAAHRLAETMQIDLAYIKRELVEIKTRLDTNFVTLESCRGFRATTDARAEPVRLLVYGLVGIILIAVVGGVVTLVVR